MKKFQLIPFLEIKGISAASGLVCQNNLVYIISDNSRMLYCYNITEQIINKIQLFQNGPEVVAKRDKPDFEAITLFDKTIYIYGSGSTKKRNIRVSYNPENKEVKTKNLSKLYKRLIKTISIADNDLNIEGVIMTDAIIYFFQRGNGLHSSNGVLYYDRKSKTARFQSIILPSLNGIPATFTDAVLVDDAIYFLAAAENTTSTYLDGEVMGSLIGTIDLKTMKLLNHLVITDKRKFEGLSLCRKTATEMEFLICEDNDSELQESTIYKLVLRN